MKSNSYTMSLLFHHVFIRGCFLLVLALCISNLAVAGQISEQFPRVEMLYQDKDYKYARLILEDILKSSELSDEDRFYAEYLLAFNYYHISLKHADSLFSKLAERSVAIQTDSLVARAIHDRIIESCGVIFLEMQGKIQKQKEPVLDLLVSTYRNRALIYEMVQAIVPLITVTRQMYLIVEGKNIERYNDTLNEIQLRQQRITRHLGPESRK